MDNAPLATNVASAGPSRLMQQASAAKANRSRVQTSQGRNAGPGPDGGHPDARAPPAGDLGQSSHPREAERAATRQAARALATAWAAQKHQPVMDQCAADERVRQERHDARAARQEAGERDARTAAARDGLSRTHDRDAYDSEGAGLGDGSPESVGQGDGDDGASNGAGDVDWYNAVLHDTDGGHGTSDSSDDLHNPEAARRPGTPGRRQDNARTASALDVHRVLYVWSGHDSTRSARPATAERALSGPDSRSWHQVDGRPPRRAPGSASCPRVSPPMRSTELQASQHPVAVAFYRAASRAARGDPEGRYVLRSD
jgi:hypothetical protein